MMMLMVRWPAPPRLRPPEFAEEEEEGDGGGVEEDGFEG